MNKKKALNPINSTLNNIRWDDFRKRVKNSNNNPMLNESFCFILIRLACGITDIHLYPEVMFNNAKNLHVLVNLGFIKDIDSKFTVFKHYYILTNLGEKYVNYAFKNPKLLYLLLFIWNVIIDFMTFIMCIGSLNLFSIILPNALGMLWVLLALLIFVPALVIFIMNCHNCKYLYEFSNDRERAFLSFVNKHDDLKRKNDSINYLEVAINNALFKQ